MPIIDCLNAYRSSITEAKTFIDIAFRVGDDGAYVHQQNQQNFITDSTFLKIFISWETFLQNSFINYMLGEMPIGGNAVIGYSTPKDFAHANKLIIGTRGTYFEWADPSRVVALSKLHFADGNPIETYINSSLQDLKDIKIIRNAAAHLSSSTIKELDGLAYRKLGRKSDNVTVSQLILSIDPKSIDKNTILQTYLNILDICVEGICNGL